MRIPIDEAIRTLLRSMELLKTVAFVKAATATITGLRELLQRGLVHCDMNQLREAIIATGGWMVVRKLFSKIAEILF